MIWCVSECVCVRVCEDGGGWGGTHTHTKDSVSAVTVYHFRCSDRIKNALLRPVTSALCAFLLDERAFPQHGARTQRLGTVFMHYRVEREKKKDKKKEKKNSPGRLIKTSETTRSGAQHLFPTPSSQRR